MFRQKAVSLFVIITAFFHFTGCNHEMKPGTKEGFYYSGIYFGKKNSKAYKQGIVDGCTTAKGVYKKSHTLFNNSQNYNDGWFLGRNKCKYLLVTEKRIKENKPK